MLWNRTHITPTLLIVVGLACTNPTDGSQPKGHEEGELIDGAADSFLRPTDHGALPLGGQAEAVFERESLIHAWTFELPHRASLRIDTHPAEPDNYLDTVLYLYRETPRGWGRAIARNDDAAGTLYSELSLPLEAGRYRILVKPFHRSIRGRFGVGIECLDCAPVEPRPCLFGDSFYELMHGERSVELRGEERITRVEQLRDPVWRSQLVIAVQQSSHTDVRTPEEALSRVDEQWVRRVWIEDTRASRRFVAYEYGVGDNSYGAIFVRDTTEIVTSIHDGDFLMCTVHPEQCALGHTFGELRDGVGFDLTSSRVLGAASLPTLENWEREQLLRTLREVYFDDSLELEAGVGLVDRGEIGQLRFIELATGRSLTVYEFGAGDTSVGAVFEGEALEFSAVISDGWLEQCAFFGEPLGVGEGGACGGELAIPCGPGLICQTESDSGLCTPDESSR